MRKIFFTLIFFLFPAISFGATFSLSPSQGNTGIGKTFTLSINTSAGGVALNAVSGVVSFPNDALEVVSLSKTGSIVSLWVEEPSFSNSVGTISFEGIVLNPGFSGNNGRVLQVTFRAKKEGLSKIGFSSGSILANDGQGTNIFTSATGAEYTVQASFAPEQGATQTTTERGPVISSETHPEEQAWYKNQRPVFSWKNENDTTSVRILYDKNEFSTPTVVYTPPIDTKAIEEDVSDGRWYFHVQLRDGEGWGGISHFAFRIDTKAPEEVEVFFLDEAPISARNPKIAISATDQTSGISHYEVKVDQGEFVRVDEATQEKPYALPSIEPGKHTLIVRAVDRAGNSADKVEEFYVEGISPPWITDFPEELTTEDILILKGSTYPDSTLTFFLERGNGDLHTQKVESEEDGKFTFIFEERLEGGTYKIEAEVMDAHGNISRKSDTLVIAVNASPLSRISSLALAGLSLIVLVVVVGAVVLYSIAYTRYKVTLLKRKLQKEVADVDNNLEKAFMLLREQVKQQLETLRHTRSRRMLTREEERIAEELSKNLKVAEDFIKEEIQDIKRQLK